MSQRAAAATLAGSLIRQAARHAPGALAERLEEEWLADLAAQPSCLARLCFALGCGWATCVIAWEHRASRAPVVTAPAGGSLSLAAFQALLPRRASAFLLVLCVHVGALYLLSSWFSFQHPHLPVLATLQVDETPVPALAPETAAAQDRTPQ
jgi:hypothetical protein